MNYLIAAQTDIGPVKKTNQDSYCIQTAGASDMEICCLP